MHLWTEGQKRCIWVAAAAWVGTRQRNLFPLQHQGFCNRSYSVCCIAAMTLYKEMRWLLKLSCCSDSQAVRKGYITHREGFMLHQTPAANATNGLHCTAVQLIHVVLNHWPKNICIPPPPPYKNSTDLHDSEKWPWQVQGGPDPRTPLASYGPGYSISIFCCCCFKILTSGLNVFNTTASTIRHMKYRLECFMAVVVVITLLMRRVTCVPPYRNATRHYLGESKPPGTHRRFVGCRRCYMYTRSAAAVLRQATISVCALVCT